MIKPLRDLLVLRPIGKPPGMVGLIHIPDNEKLANATGGACEVLAAGKDCVLAKKGSKVYVKAYGDHFAGDEVHHDGEKLIMIKERDIVGVLP